jgi:uncharacterized protein (TIGR00725 family)
LTVLSGRYVAVVGASRASPHELEAAHAVGRGLATAGIHLVCGGRGGVMAAACRGAREVGGLTIGLLPGRDRSDANEWVAVSIPTGLGELRNALVTRSAEVVVAVGGAYGTLSEIALALQAGTPVLGVGTWKIDGIEHQPDAGTAVVRACELLDGVRAPKRP